MKLRKLASLQSVERYLSTRSKLSFSMKLASLTRKENYLRTGGMRSTDQKNAFLQSLERILLICRTLSFYWEIRSFLEPDKQPVSNSHHSITPLILQSFNPSQKPLSGSPHYRTI